MDGPPTSYIGYAATAYLAPCTGAMQMVPIDEGEIARLVHFKDIMEPPFSNSIERIESAPGKIANNDGQKYQYEKELGSHKNHLSSLFKGP